MSLFTDPPRSTKRQFARGDVHLGVWALQRLLNVVYEGKQVALVQDGAFGPGTETRVRKYQADVGAASDGIVGPQTQERMVRSCVVRAPHGPVLPKGLIEGLIQSESGGLIAAVNASVAGGLDLGLTQRRVFGPPFSAALVQQAIDPPGSVAASVEELYTRYLGYRVGRHPSCPFNPWELAVLHHNWPWAAQTYHRLGRLPNPDQAATWVPASLPASARTYDGWARFYVGMVTRGVKW